MDTVTTKHRRSWQVIQRSGSGCTPTTQSDPNRFSLDWEDFVQRGGSIPNYKQLIASGQDATTSLSGEKVTVEASGGSAKVTSYRNYFPDELPDPCYPSWLEYRGQLIQPFLAPYFSLGMTSADNQALASFVSNARSAQSEIQSIVIAGEFGKTLKMLTGAARGLRSGVLKHLVGLEKDKRGFKNASNKRKRKHLSEKWLEFQYGYKPLINDVQNAAEYLARRALSNRPDLRRVGSKGSEEVKQSIGPGAVYVGAHSNQFEYWLTEKADVRYYGAVYLATSDFGSSIETAGLKVGDFIPSIWELVPYSFLVDYFTNVGDIISAATFAASNFAWKAKGTKASVIFETNNYKLVKVPPGPFDLARDEVSISPGSVRSTRTIINRSRHEGGLIPTLEFSLPGSTTKWINIGALLSVHSRIVPF